VLLNGINHIALISQNIDRLREFYAEVFEAEVGPTRPHGEKDDETMTMIRIGPHTELNVVTIEGNPEPAVRHPCGDADGSIISGSKRRRTKASRRFGTG
jgi:catechol 2,3-dioxygenase-like lactoylglutathione lyase family enzyme